MPPVDASRDLQDQYPPSSNTCQPHSCGIGKLFLLPKKVIASTLSIKVPLLLTFLTLLCAGYLSQEKLELPNMDTRTLGQRVLARRKELRLNNEKPRASLELLTSQFHNGKRRNPASRKTIVCFSGCSEVLPTWLMFGDEDKAPVPAQELLWKQS